MPGGAGRMGVGKQKIKICRLGRTERGAPEQEVSSEVSTPEPQCRPLAVLADKQRVTTDQASQLVSPAAWAISSRARERGASSEDTQQGCLLIFQACLWFPISPDAPLNSALRHGWWP